MMTDDVDDNHDHDQDDDDDHNDEDHDHHDDDDDHDDDNHHPDDNVLLFTSFFFPGHAEVDFHVDCSQENVRINWTAPMSDEFFIFYNCSDSPVRNLPANLHTLGCFLYVTYTCIQLQF